MFGDDIETRARTVLYDASSPAEMRVMHLAHDAEALARLRSPGEAISVIRDRSGHAYDPAPAGEFLPVAAEAFARLDKLDPWDAALACEPGPRRVPQPRSCAGWPPPGRWTATRPSACSRQPGTRPGAGLQACRQALPPARPRCSRWRLPG